MRREFTLTVDDVEYPVIADGNTITINGRDFTVDDADDGTVLVDSIAYDVAIGDGKAVVGGRPHSLRVAGLAEVGAPLTAPSTSVALRPGQAGAGAVLAVMPGKITRVLVEEGQDVREGDPVCVLEAMKMENELVARQNGTVNTVHVQPGDDVEKDQVLLEIA